MPALFARALAPALLQSLLLAGCGGTVGTGSDETPAAPAPLAGAYDGHGFIVHEWGTNTVVVGSDGSMQRGLHHEEEALPAFVYDRVRAATLSGPDSLLSVNCKLETPVTYFYSREPRVVRAAVDFPQGIFTQWFPAAERFQPLLAEPCLALGKIADPWLDPGYPFNPDHSDLCSQRFESIAAGQLDWGTVELLSRDAPVDSDLPSAPLDEFTWSHAREVASNPVRAAGLPRAGSGSELERFLFYRGLGNFELPVIARALGENRVSLENHDPNEAMGALFVLNVAPDRAAFELRSAGIPPGRLELVAPSLEAGAPISDYSSQLASAMTDALVSTGLYADEARAMVETWKRQWFVTPGLRVLYLMPQSWTDRMIPLSIEPQPDRVVRTMVIRVELITPELESQDVAALAGLAGGEAERATAERHFVELGRFAEPRLRRALTLSGQPAAGAALLERLGASKAAASLGE